ncbi:MAG: hypothetical protein FWE70_04760 [Oscillospiraceae bacterium]|nr:hypothetical protein [Oscillospiraceae bacterium]
MHTHHYLDGFFAVETDYPGLREGHGRRRLYSEAQVFVEPGDLIVGRLDRALERELVTAFTCLRHIHEIHEGRIAAFMADEGISAAEKADVKSRIEAIKEYSPAKGMYDAMTPEQRAMERSGAALAQWYNGHIAMDFGHALRTGLGPMASSLRARMAGHGRPGFHEALALTAEGMGAHIRRHADLARSLIGGGGGHDDADLAAIAEACESVAEGPARSFREAVQLQWFLMTFTEYDSFGRYDQYMLPFYERDLATGAITRGQAKDFLKDMMRRVEGNGGILNMTIGGLTPDGGDAVSDLTYLIMEATRELRMKGPNLCLRIRADSDPRLWEEAMESLSTGQSLPALYNDDVYVPMMGRAGFGEADSNGYTLIGCSQAAVPYTSNLNCAVGLFTPAKMLELALHDGYDTRTEAQVGPHTGDAAGFTDFGQVMEAYGAQMRHCVAMGVSMANMDMRARRRVLSSSRTLLMPECVERGLGFHEGGCSSYGAHSQIVGLTNVADSLAAIKEVVFDQGHCAMGELIEALDADFMGHEGLRARLMAAPKFGNDIAYVDGLRARVTSDIYAEITSYPAELGGRFWAGEVIFIFHFGQGACVGALPDGRRAYGPLADSAGAGQGRDMGGVTALLKSCARLPFGEAFYTSVNLNVKFGRVLWDGQRDKVKVLLMEYFAMGGGQLQVNVADAAELREAMERPEEHKSLTVRVGGFSAYFTQLPREQQLEIASRTTHESLVGGAR